jgi:ABC-type branched-subunit amino acid transport system ATPase component/ABC-type branched-subunit amino acid transport system permease subunit
MTSDALKPALATLVGVVAVLAASQLFAGTMPLGLVLLGALLGTASGLMAVGLVLTYQTTRVINFGYGAIGTMGAGVAAGAAAGRGIPWPIALPLGVMAGVGAGALFELIVVRRLANAPRLVLTVATIGLAQMLPGLAPYMAQWFDVEGILNKVDTPWDHIEVTVDPVIFNGNDLALLAVVPVVLVALTWFLLRTEAGTAVRGMADNMDRARLLGIPVGRLSLLVWSIAGGIAALTVALRIPNDGLAFDAAAGPSALLPALAAAVVTGMTSPTRAFVAGVALGVVDQLVRWNVDRQATTTLVLLAVIVVGLLVQRALGTGLGRGGADGGSAWTVVGSGRRLPRALDRLPEVRAARVVIGLAIAAALVAIPVVGSSSQVNYATVTLVYAIVAVSLVVLTGWGGVVSLGQIAVVGVGGVVAANLIADRNMDLFVTLGASALAGGFVALLIGLPALRVSGQFLAVTTLAFAVAMQLYVLNPANYESWLPSAYPRPELWGAAGLSDERWLYALALGVLAASVAVVRNLRRARTGRVISAGRDNDRAAAAAGVDTVETRLVAFVFAGVLAGVAGAIHAIALRGVGFNTYEAADSLLVFSMAVIGGVASLGGTLAGVALVQWLGYAFPKLQLLLTGIGLLAILMVLPGGLAQALERIRDKLAYLVGRLHGIRIVDELAVVDQSRSALARSPVGGPGGPGAPGAPGPNGGAGWPGGGNGPGTGPPPAPPGYGDRRGAPAYADQGNGQPRGAPLLACEGVEASYGSLQVLFGIDAAVGDREMVALLGTNGAGKSTLLRSIAGLLPPDKGRVTFAGESIAGLPAEKIARRGLSLMPGGKGVFPTLSVAENLRLACWMLRGDERAAAAAREEALDLFPILRQRAEQRAGNLSGGEQQQLSLAMAFVTRPKLLCIDELSLGLAPTIVGQLVEKVREMHTRGMAIVVVEQSVNVALLLCERAVFLEKGQVRFRGPTAGLLDRPEILRAVFIGAGEGIVAARPATAPRAERTGRGVRLECRDLVKRFGGIRAVDGVDLTVEPGTIVGLIGHNGAGKTTLFDLVTGFLPADAGQVLLGGVDVTRRSSHRRAKAGLGRSFQEARLFPSLTVVDTLRVGLERHLRNRDPIAAALRLPASADSEREATWRADELVELLGLGDYRDRLTGELSTGTRRVVELGFLLGQDPAVLLLDEPSAGVAQSDTEALGPMLRRVQAETGCSMVVIEHDINLLRSLCDEMVALEQGAVIARGHPAEVLAAPRVIASYLGTDENVVERSGRPTRAPR